MFDLRKAISDELADCPSTLEFGSMFGDILVLAPGPVRIGVEAHAPYIGVARERHGDSMLFMHAEALRIAPVFGDNSFDAVLLVDVVEHFVASAAIKLVKHAQRIARNKVVTFIPLGVHEQTVDVFNMGADHWQRHRSTWYPQDAQALGFEITVCEDFHLLEKPQSPHAMFGLYRKPK